MTNPTRCSQSARLADAAPLTATMLPWNDRAVHRAGNLHHFFASRLPSALTYHLPPSTTLCADLEVSAREISEFLEAAAAWLVGELTRREQRRGRFVELGLFEEAALHAALTRRHVQPWIIYYSKEGGLRESEVAPPDVNAGVIPCSSMRNHGVGWRANEDGAIRVWLVTARKKNEVWDWDSDIGHESAHAAFAPVPLFTQSAGQELDAIRFAQTANARDLTSDQLARMCYLFTELAVVAMRGEARATETRLPLGQAEELHAFLRLLKDAMPGMGFDRALGACERVHGVIPVEDGPEIFEIGAAALCALKFSIGFTNEPHIERVVRRIFSLNRK